MDVTGSRWACSQATGAGLVGCRQKCFGVGFALLQILLLPREDGKTLVLKG